MLQAHLMCFLFQTWNQSFLQGILDSFIGKRFLKPRYQVCRTSLVVQRLRLWASTAGSIGLIPSWETKIPHPAHGVAKKLREKKKWWLRSRCACCNWDVIDSKHSQLIEQINIWVYLLVLSRVWFFATPWTIAHQASLSMEFSRQEYRSGLPFPTPGDVPNPGV